MKRLSQFVLVGFVLAGCTSAQQATKASLMENPLFAKLYALEVVNFVTNLEISKNPVTEDPAKQAAIDKTRDTWMPILDEILKKERLAGQGGFVQVLVPTSGVAMYLDDMVYFDPTFYTSPSPSARVHLTKAVDPRLVEFPDETSIDLGELISPYGAQQYAVPAERSTEYRTVVLWDEDLELVLGFAQLSYTADAVTEIK